MAPYWNGDFGNPHSNKHAFGWRADEAISIAREHVANLIGALSSEIIFVSGATEGNNLAILGSLLHEEGKDRNVVVSAIEHKCVLASSRYLEQRGYEVRKAPVSDSGHVDLGAISTLIDKNTALVAVMLVNNEIGTIQPIAEIAKRAHAVGAILHCDAAQAATGVKIHVDGLGVDTLSLSSHKFPSQGRWRALRRPIDARTPATDHPWRRTGGRPSRRHIADALVCGIRRSRRILHERHESDSVHMERCRGASSPRSDPVCRISRSMAPSRSIRDTSTYVYPASIPTI